MPPPKFLSDILKKDQSNFDILRLIAALGVMVGHAYAIAPQPPLQDRVLTLLHFDYSGSLAVKFFFFLSGMLVTNSILSKPNAVHFMIKRACRIFPALLVCLLVAVLVVGPLFTRLPLSVYFGSQDTWSYVYRNLFLVNLQDRLTGVLTDSRLGLNGSLWTLPAEMLCYLYLAVFFGLGFLRHKVVANLFFIAVIIVCFTAPRYLPLLFAENEELHLIPACFALGALFANNKKWIDISFLKVILIWLLARLLLHSMAFQFLFYLALFYTTVYLASLPFVIRRLHLPFDASYGVYIYGFMIQQCIHAVLPNIGVHRNQALSMVIALMAGIASWYGVEKRFIVFGHRITSSEILSGVAEKDPV